MIEATKAATRDSAGRRFFMSFFSLKLTENRRRQLGNE